MSAPGRLENLRQFVNSLDLDHPERDPLASPVQAQTWLGNHGLASGMLTDQEAAEIRDLREALRSELLAHAGEEPDADTWTALATKLAGSGLRITFQPEGGVSLEPAAARGAEGVRGAIATLIYEAVQSGKWRRLKACRKHTCQFAFYDRSKNGSGAWCDMAVCGNRVKAQRRRDRDRAVVRKR